jgi:hypothetical protein
LPPVPALVVLDAADLRDRYAERAAIVEFDGKVGRARAEARAWNEVAVIWFRQHGEKAPDGRCAYCGRALSDEADVLLLTRCERSRASPECCIITYGQRWRCQAAVGLAAIGIPTPLAIVTEISENAHDDDKILIR